MYMERNGRARARILAAFILLALALGIPRHASAQSRASGSPTLDSLLARAIAANPDIVASQLDAAAARSRVRSAGSLNDPTLIAGLMNVPASGLSFTEAEMTMKVIGLNQRIPYPGKRRLEKKVAELVSGAESLRADDIRLSIIREVNVAYYEIAYLDAALDATKRLDRLSGDVIRAADLRYAAGRGGQQDVLRANLEASRLNETANDLMERRRAAVARVAALVDEPDLEMREAAIPARVAQAAVDSVASRISFASRELGSAVSNQVLPPLAEMQRAALELNPDVRRMSVMSDAASARLDLADRAHLPDVDVTLQYGQRSGYMTRPDGTRSGRPDLVSLMVSIPLAIQRGGRQAPLANAARADASSAEARKRGAEALVRAEVSRLYSEISRSRTQLALYVRALLPQARASLASSSSAYQSGSGDLNGVLDSRRMLLDLELGYHRSMSDFAQGIASLERLTGQEILR